MEIPASTGAKQAPNSGAFNFIKELERERFFGEVTMRFKDGVAYLFTKNQTLRPEDFGGKAAA